MVARKSKVRVTPHDVMTVNRGVADNMKLVYVLIAQRPLHYRKGKSRVAYIGTTKRGERRVAASAADKAASILAGRGVSRFGVRLVTCRPRPRIRIWEHLEKALLFTFEDMYWELPKFNRRRGYKTEDAAYRFFRRDRLRQVVTDLS